MRSRPQRTLVLLLLTGLAVRIACLPLQGTVDMDVWKTWSYAASQRVDTVYGVGGNPPIRGEIRWGKQLTTVDYPPGTMYGLALVGRAYRLIDPSFTDGVGLTILVKLSVLIADSLVILGLWLLLRPWSEAAAYGTVLTYWLNPTAIMDGAVLGYLDPWYGAVFLLGLAALSRGRYGLGGAVLALAAFVKPQATLASPAALVLLWQCPPARRVRAVLTAAGAALAVALVMIAPYARIGALPNLRQGLASLLRHDMLSGEAANAWWIVTWILRASYGVHDLGVRAAWTMRVYILGVNRFVELGYPNPRPFTALLTASVMAWAAWRARRASLPVVISAGALSVHAYYCLSVQVHENHLYLAVPLMAAAAAGVPRLRGPYVLVSIVFLLNLFLFQGFGRGFRLPWRGITSVDATVLLSFVQLGALVWHARRFAAAAAAETSAGDAIPRP